MFRQAIGQAIGASVGAGWPPSVPSTGPRAARVTGFLRSATQSDPELNAAEQRITHFVASRGWELTGVTRDYGIITLADSGLALEQLLTQIGQGQVHGVVTLASYTFSWDHEVVRFVEQRVAQLGGFVAYLYGR